MKKETKKSTAKTHKCDLCGKGFSEKPNKVYDENFKLQRGLIQCNKCLTKH